MVIDLRRQVGPLLELLDKLRDEWRVPEADQEAFTHALDHAERRTFATLKALEHFAETLHSAFGILAAQDTEHQRAQTDRLHDRLDVVSAVFLVPALIAGIYGANTAIPGGGSWWGFVAMCVLMFLGVTLALLYLGKFPYEPLMRRWPKSLRRKRHRA
jgi:Mg2+ and Co2+ transporter CorA